MQRRPRGQHLTRHRRLGKNRRGVSDVVATILLLALTVTLFASIFAFVTSFPSAPAQNNNQFQATETYTANQSYVSSIRILHLAGPPIAGTGQVYLKSSNDPTASEFSSPYPVSSGLGGSNSWNLGQTWIKNFTAPNIPSSHDNITVYIVSGTTLVFSVILPGTSVVSPPTVVSTSTAPATPLVGQTFTVYAVLAGSYTSNSVYVSLASVPGGPSAAQKMTLNAQGQWYYTLTGGASSNGTYYGFVNASSSTGQTAVSAVTIVVTTGGGTTNGPFSVGVILVPSPPNTGTTESVQAVVTYTGVLGSQKSLNVTFTAISSPYVAAYKWTGWAPTGATIMGQTSVTVVSQTTWTIPANPTTGTSFIVYANATVTTIGMVPGTMTFTPAYLSLSASSGLIGSTVTATGSSFVGLTAVSFTEGGVAATITACSSDTSFTAASVVTTAAGGFVCTVQIAAGTPYIAATMIAADAATGQNDSAAFAVNDWTISPLNPTTGLLGSSVVVSGKNFAASSVIALTFDGTVVTPTANATCTLSGTSVKASGTGTFICGFSIPTGASAGAGSLVATNLTWSTTATAPFSVKPWSLALSPTAGDLHNSTTITGLNYSAGSLVSFTFQGFTVSTAAPMSLACSGYTMSGNSVTTSTAGKFVCTFNIPYTASAGSQALIASDSSGPTPLSSSYTVTPWLISINNASIAHGTATTYDWVNGTGFTVSSTLSLYFAGAVITPTSCSAGSTLSGNVVTVSTGGTFACKYKVPSATAAEIQQYMAVDATSGQVATCSLTRT